MAILFDSGAIPRFVVEGSGGGSTLIKVAVSRLGDRLDAAVYEWFLIPKTDQIGGAVASAEDFIDPLGELPAGLVVFEAGSASAQVTIQIAADNLKEEDLEGFELVVAGSNGDPEKITLQFFIQDDEQTTLPSVNVSVAPAAVREDANANLVYSFTRDGNLEQPLTINIGISGSANATASANDPADYSEIAPAASGRQLTFAAGAASASLAIDPIADSNLERDESVTLTLLNGSGYVAGSKTTATGAILNDDATVQVSVSPRSVLEDGKRKLVYTFRRRGSLALPLSVNYTVSGTASPLADRNGPADYSGIPAEEANRLVRFAAGAATTRLIVDPTSDGTGEADESVTLSLADGTGYGFSEGASATGVIRNDDTSVSLSVAPEAIEEDGKQTLVYTFRRSGVLSKPLDVRYSVSGTATLVGTARNPADVAGLPSKANDQHIRFAAGSDSVRLSVHGVADERAEPDETLILKLLPSGPQEIGPASSATGVIANDDPVLTTVTSSARITIPNKGEATPYASTLRVDDLTGAIVDVSVDLFNVNHAFPDDLDILLVSPAGAAVMLMSDCGGGFDLTGINLRFSRSGKRNLPDSDPIVKGTYRPTDVDKDKLPAPAPLGPYSQDLSILRGSDPNGNWRLFVFDDLRGGNGAIEAGWALNLTTN